MEYKITNASAAEVSVEVEQRFFGGDIRADDESQRGTMLDAHRRLWVVKVPAHGETILTSQTEQEW
jgi:hypothetical protein